VGLIGVTELGVRPFKMKSVVPILLVFASMISANAGSDREPHIIKIDNQRYEEPNVDIEKIKSEWDFRSSQFPPISLNEAYRKSKAAIDKLRPNETWNLVLAQLMTWKNKAVYELMFQRDEHLSEDQKQDGVKETRIVTTVLMDGTLFAPKPIN